MQLDLFKFHPLSEQICDVICTKVQNYDRAFFRIEIAYHLAKVASNMHVSVRTASDSVLPVNMFAFAFADSGYGKNYSQHIIEELILGEFEENFVEVIYPAAAREAISKKAKVIAKRTGMDEMEIDADLTRDFNEMGDFLYGFPEGTSPALKQLCKAITYSNLGAASLEMDEVGYNITQNQDLLSTLLELFDVGRTKEKLTKATKESKRAKSMKGCTPANVFAFGTPSTAFDGGKTEAILSGFFKAGFGRRSFFAYGDISVKHAMAVDSEEVYLQLTDKALTATINTISEKIGLLASMDLTNKEIYIDVDAERFRLRYNQYCHERAVRISEYRPVERAEMLHRATKVTKLAGAYAFIDGSDEVTQDHIEYAISVAEASGESLKRIMNQPKAHVRLANFLCEYGTPVTEADLVEYLPFYSGSIANKRDLMTLAMAYGHRNAMAIKSFEESGVTMWTGEALAPTDIDNLIVSHSTDLADNYTNVNTSLAELAKFVGENDTNFCNHHFRHGQIGKGNRSKVNTLEGCNLAVFDIDSSKVQPQVLHAMLRNFNHIIYETKSSTPDAPRYRLGIVLSHVVKFDDMDYKRFAKAIGTWLPVIVDVPAIQRERKYRTYSNKQVWFNDKGDNLNVMAYYPNTKEADENVKHHTALTEARILGMKRWVIHTAKEGNRNNTLYAYVRFLLEHMPNTPHEEIIKRVKELNNRLVEPLEESELDETLLTSLKP